MPTWSTRARSTPVRYLVHGIRLTVRSDDEAVLAHVEDTYGAFRDDRPAGPSIDDGGALELALVHEPDGTVVVGADGMAFRWGDDDVALVALFDRIVAALTTELGRRGVLAIHAGAVAVDGRAIILAGRSGGGKTTLVLGLLRNGAGLLTDELALVAPEDRTILPYPRGLHVRPSTLDLVPELGFLAALPRHELGGGSEWAVGPDALARAFGTAVAAPTPLGAVILLDGAPDPGQPPSISAVPPAIATMELLRGTPAAARDFAGTLERIPRIVAEVPCARLRAGELRATADAVLAWTGSRR